MTREIVEKAIARMDELFDALGHPGPMSYADEDFKEAWIEEMMKEENVDDFDYETRKWFVSDEKWPEVKERSIREYNKAVEFANRVAERAY